MFLNLLKIMKINEYTKIEPDELVNNVKFWALYATSFYEKLLAKIENPEVVKSVYRNLMTSEGLSIEDKKALTFFYRIRRNEIDDPNFWKKIHNREDIKENYNNPMKKINEAKKNIPKVGDKVMFLNHLTLEPEQAEVIEVITKKRREEETDGTIVDLMPGGIIVRTAEGNKSYLEYGYTRGKNQWIQIGILEKPKPKPAGNRFASMYNDMDSTYESFPTTAKFVKESLNEKRYSSPGFYPQGYDKVIGIYSDTINNLDDSILNQFEKYESDGRIKGRIAPTNDYLIFYKNGDKEIEDFLKPYEATSNLTNESLNEFNNAFGPMAASSNYERGGDKNHNELVDRVGEIEQYIWDNGDRVSTMEWDDLVENMLYGQPGEYDPDEMEEIGERYLDDLDDEELRELIHRGEFLIKRIKKYKAKGLKEYYDPEPDELSKAKMEARRISREEGVVQHVNEVRPGVYIVEDWYDSDTTVASYENGEKIN